LRTWKLTVEYDGTNYQGWQEQTNAKGVASEIRRAAEGVLGVAVELTGSGRTDAGVHALAQVAHLRAPRNQPFPHLADALNAKLPSSIVILEAADAPADFDARRQATSRSYVYRISTRRTAFEKKYVWWIKQALDERRMSEAVDLLPGRHDFAAFAQKDPSKPGTSSVVTVLDAGLQRDGNLLLFRIEATRFLWKMVRRITGSLARIGTGELALDDFRAFLRGRRDARIAEWTAPASGLFLEAITYDHGRPAVPD
jgi:tRNA pseudouridine38-40 synthase